jgi:hypothetical protein
MKRVTSIAVGSLVGSLLMGCGFTDPGSGTQTLFVNASATTDGSNGGTVLSALIREQGPNGPTVDDATVIMTGDTGTDHSLPLILCCGIYGVNNVTWETGWRLKITRGNDKLEAFLSAPGLTTILEPTAGSTFVRSAGTPLHVRWKDESGKSAETVEVRLSQGDYNQGRPEDPGTRDVPATAWTQAENNERVTVKRTTDTNLSGGITGSVFTASSTADVNFVVAN